MLKRTTLTAAIALLTVSYACAQQKVTERQIRELVRQEVMKSLARKDAVAKPKAKPATGTPIFLPTAIRTDRRYTGVPYGVFPNPYLRSRTTSTNSVSKALAATEKAIAADKSLSKRQRARALKGLEMIRNAVKSTGKKAESRRGKGQKNKKKRGAAARRKGKARKAKKNGKGRRKAGKNKKQTAAAAKFPAYYFWSTTGPKVQPRHKNQPIPILQYAPGSKLPTLEMRDPARFVLPQPSKVDFRYLPSVKLKKGTKPNPTNKKRKSRDL